MRRIFLVILAIAIVLVGAVIAATFLIPGEVYKQKIEEAAENALQRDVTLEQDALHRLHHRARFPPPASGTGARRLHSSSALALSRANSFFFFLDISALSTAGVRILICGHQSSETVLQKALGEDQATTKLEARDLGTGSGKLFKCVCV